MKFYFVYIIESQENNRKYIGFTSDVFKRLSDHNSGKSKYTKAFVPWKLVYFESYSEELKARKRELQLKKSSWHKKQLFDRLFET